jgi:hypothetical protein
VHIYIGIAGITQFNMSMHTSLRRTAATITNSTTTIVREGDELCEGVGALGPAEESGVSALRADEGCAASLFTLALPE